MPRLSASVRRTLGALLLLCFVAASLLDAFHRAVVEHAICPADGALAHVENDSHHAGGADKVEPAFKQGGDEERADHGHCGLPELGASDGSIDTPPAVHPPKVGTARDRVQAGALAHRPVELLSLAPKQSPPRAV